MSILLRAVAAAGIACLVAIPGAANAGQEPPARYAFDDVEISFEIGAGWGVYHKTLKIKGNGQCFFTESDRFPDSATGVFEHQGEFVLPEAEFLELLNRFYAVDFFSLKPRYTSESKKVVVRGGELWVMGSKWMDSNTRTISIRLGDYEKSITLVSPAPTAPEELRQLVEFLEEMVPWKSASR